MIRTKTAIIDISQNGIVLARINPDSNQGLPEATENLAATIAQCDGQKRPLLVDIRRCQPLEPEARRYYSGKVLTDHFTALAILVDMSPVGVMTVNVYLKIAKVDVPVKMFTDESKAESWLLEHRI